MHTHACNAMWVRERTCNSSKVKNWAMKEMREVAMEVANKGLSSFSGKKKDNRQRVKVWARELNRKDGHRVCGFLACFPYLGSERDEEQHPHPIMLNCSSLSSFHFKLRLN